MPAQRIIHFHEREFAFSTLNFFSVYPKDKNEARYKYNTHHTNNGYKYTGTMVFGQYTVNIIISTL